VCVFVCVCVTTVRGFACQFCWAWKRKLTPSSYLHAFLLDCALPRPPRSSMVPVNNIWVHIYIYVYICIHMHIYKYIRIYICIYIYIHLYVCIYMYISMYMYMYSTPHFLVLLVRPWCLSTIYEHIYIYMYIYAYI